MDPELLQQLAQAGMTEEQLRMLGPRLQMGQQMMQPQTAQGSQVGTGPFQTYVAASPLEHLANAARQIIGAKIARGAMDKQQDLLAQQQKARQGAFQGLQTAMSGGQGGTLGEAGGGMARPPDPQAAQALMTAMAGSGDSALQAGAHFGLQSQHMQNELQKLQNQYGYQQGMLGIREQGIQQKEREQKTQFDPFGNRITTRTHAPSPTSVLPLTTGGGAGPQQPKTPWSQQALDQSTEQYATTGDYKRMPGRAGAGFDLAVKNRAAELYPGTNLATNKAGYVADMNSLRKMQGQSDAMESFETTALKNLDTFLNVAHTVVDTGSPLFNAPARKFQQSVAGDPNMTAFNAARQVAVQEISKVLGGSLGGTAVSDSARHEASGLLTPDASIAQIEKAAQILKTDMANRKGAVTDQLNTIRGRLQIQKGGAPAAAAPAVPAPATPPAASPTVRVKYKGQLLDIPAGRLPEAIKDGAEQVK